MHAASAAVDAGHTPAIAAAAGAGVTPAGILGLQRHIGNRATVALIQREPPLEDPEAVAAKAEGARPGAARGWSALRGLVKESQGFNKPRKQSGPLVMDEGIAEALGSEGAAKFAKLIEAREARQKKTTTAGGAFIASQVNSKEKIGSSAAYITPQEREGHLGEFLLGAHAFVSNDAYLKIRGQHLTEANFNAWGAGSNFVAPLADADKLVEEAAAEGGRGLFHLEEALGIPKMSWVNQCKSADYGIWRFKILKPEALNLRIPSGGEYGAYGSWVDRGGAAHRGEWRPGGRTLGGAKEAVIDQIGVGKFGESGDGAGQATRSKLAELEGDGILKVVLDTSMSANTKRVLSEMAPPG
ncbi:MAG TPA: hypothetical protein VHT30_01600 [Acidimicrobiales bacterium]|nr:hypothetical protein [Acidimicrobiales bacterium]